MSKKEKKGCCLFTLAKWFLIGCGLLFILILVIAYTADTPEAADKAAPTVTAAPATQAPTATPKADPTPTPQPTATPEPTPEKLIVPGIDGSQAYDVILSLEEQGISKPDTRTTQDGLFEWSSNLVTMGGSVVYYEIIANSKHEILSATFNMAGSDNGFLTFAATLPYAAADKEKAVQFVKDHMTGEDSTITIGDAVFSIYPYDNGGAMLTIADVDSEAYYMAAVNQMLSE